MDVSINIKTRRIVIAVMACMLPVFILIGGGCKGPQAVKDKNIENEGGGKVGHSLVADKKQKVKVGREVVISSVSPVHGNLQVVFEDDRETGYFYALDTNHEQPIMDARHIYDVKAVADKNIPSEVVIAWSKGGSSAILFINNYPHAVMDFENNHGFCRSGFPPRGEESPWFVKGHEWDEERYSEIISEK